MISVCDEYVLREYTLESNLRQAYSIAWDMCTEELQAKLIGIKDFKVNIGDPLDVIKLFQEIWKFMFNFQEKRYTQHNVLMTWKKFYEMKQQPEESVQEYYEWFKLQVKVVESIGGSFGRDDALLSNAGFVGNALKRPRKKRRKNTLPTSKFSMRITCATGS